MITWQSTIAATNGSGTTATASYSDEGQTSSSSGNASPASGYSTSAETNSVFTDVPFSAGGSTSSDFNGTTQMQSYSGYTVTFDGMDYVTTTTAFTDTTVNTGLVTIGINTTQNGTITSTWHNTTTAKTLTQTFITGTHSTSTYSVGTATSSHTVNTTTTTTRTQIYITTSTRTTTSTCISNVTTQITLTEPYWLATVLKAERTEWLWMMKTGNTLTGPRIISDVADSFVSSVFGPTGFGTGQTIAPEVADDWTGVAYSTATAAAASSAVGIHTTTTTQTTATSVNFSCLPPATVTVTCAIETLSDTTVTMEMGGVYSTSPELTAAGTTKTSTLNVTSWESLVTTVTLRLVNESGFDTGMSTTTANSTRTFTSTMIDTCNDDLVVGSGQGLTVQDFSFAVTQTTGLTFVGGFEIYIPVSGKGVKLPWLIEDTRGMFSNISGVSNTIPWTSWAMAQQTGVTSPLPPLRTTTMLDGAKTWYVSWNSSGLFATERTQSTNATGTVFGTTTHSYSPAGAGAITQTWLVTLSALNTTARYATEGFGCGGTLAVSSESARVRKQIGVLNIGTGTSTSRVLVSAETFDSVSETGRMTWGRETAASIDKVTVFESAGNPPAIFNLSRNPSIIP